MLTPKRPSRLKLDKELVLSLGVKTAVKAGSHHSRPETVCATCVMTGDSYTC